MVLVWEPIKDLPQDWSSLTDGELGPLLQFWNDQRADLEQSGVLKNFTQRLAREWSIETGQIEGVYDIDRGITQTLIERGIDADLIGTLPGQKPPELIAAIIQDHADVLEGLFQFIKGDRPLSKSYIHELHAALLHHQETTAVLDQFGNFFEARLLKGRYKKRPNNPKRSDGTIHQYCPPEQVESEMDHLLALHSEHEKSNVPIEVEAAWLHHRFTQIHPYQDGNGRVARALASLVFMKRGWFPVVVTRDDRPRYIDALEAADEGDLRPLVSFFVSAQRRTLLQATQAAADVQQVHTVDDAIAAAKRVLADTGKSLGPSIWSAAKETADRLVDIANQRLKQVDESLTTETGKNRPSIHLTYKRNPVDDGRDRSGFISLHGMDTIAISIHPIGSRFRGLMGVEVRFEGVSGVRERASREIFQVNYVEPYESTERRFRIWLEESLVNALTLWRKSL
jgi:Fic family protein